MRHCKVIVLASSFLAFSGVASAGVVAPPLAIELQLNGQTVWTDDPKGMAEDDGSFSYGGGDSTTSWVLEYEANTMGGDTGLGERGARLSWVNLSADIMNIDAVAHHFTLFATMPIAPPITPAVMGGSAQGGLSAGASPATLNSVAGSSIFAGLIDMMVAPGAELFPHLTSIAASPFGSDSLGSDSFGNPIPSDPAPDVFSSLGVRFDFMLDPGATATLSGVFVVNIPTPASLALFLAAGFVAVRRSRD